MTESKIPQANELLYIVKLITGEDLLVTMIDTNDTQLQLKNQFHLDQYQ
jgi:hypothetical protein